jgi:hypothetical protein
MSGIHLTYVTTRSPPAAAKRMITAAAVQPCHHRHKTVRRGHRKTVLRVSSGTIKTVRRDRRHRKTVYSAVQQDCQDSPACSVRQSGVTAAAGNEGLFGRAAQAAANLARTNLQGTAEVVPRGRPTPPAIPPAHRPLQGRVTADNICSCLYPYICYIYV